MLKSILGMEKIILSMIGVGFEKLKEVRWETIKALRLNKSLVIAALIKTEAVGSI